MTRQGKITIALPKALMMRVQKDARKSFKSPREYIRDLVINAYVAPPNIKSAPIAPKSAGSEPERAAHKSSKTRSGYRGVYPYGARRWAAVVSSNGRQQRIAVCDTPEQAAAAYDTWMIANGKTDAGAPPNASAQRTQEALAVDAPFFNKLQTGQQLSDIEMKQWSQATRAVPTAPSSALPVTINAQPTDGAQAPIVAPIRRQLRRGPGPAIDRPAADPDEQPEGV